MFSPPGSVPGEEAAPRHRARDFYREALARLSRRGTEDRREPGPERYEPGAEGARHEEEHPSRREERRRRHEQHMAETHDYGRVARGGPDMDPDELARRYHDPIARSPRSYAWGPGASRGTEGSPASAGREPSAWELGGEERGRAPSAYDRAVALRGGDHAAEALQYDRARMRDYPPGVELPGGGQAGVGRREQRRGWHSEPLTAGEVMTRNPRTLRPDNTLRDAALLMREESVGILPVVDGNGRLLGVITDRDIVVRAVQEDRVPSQTRVRDFMSEDLDVATEDEPLSDLIAMMGRKQVRRVPVVGRESRLIGIVSMTDIAARADRDEELQGALQRLASRRSFWRRLH